MYEVDFTDVRPLDSRYLTGDMKAVAVGPGTPFMDSYFLGSLTGRTKQNGNSETTRPRW